MKVITNRSWVKGEEIKMTEYIDFLSKFVITQHDELLALKAKIRYLERKALENTIDPISELTIKVEEMINGNQVQNPVR
jgi:hypothetical protein